MSHNTIQMFVFNHFMEIVINQFSGENRSGGNGPFGTRSKQICNLLCMTLNHLNMSM